MAKKSIMKLTVPGSNGYHAQVGGNDPVSDGGKVNDKPAVTAWVIDQFKRYSPEVPRPN
jgi:hypothetical protein